MENFKKGMKIFLVTLFIVCFSSGILLAANLTKTDVITGQELFVPEVNYSSFQLENGLKVYVFEDHQIPLVNVAVWYKVGSIDEPEGITGISHLLEHMMFLGTDTLDKDQIHKLVKSVGGTNNASTNYDYTRYYEKVPSSKLEMAMAIEADRMRNLRINPDEFKREKQVVMQERRMRVENNVFSSSLEKIQAKAFKKSPLHHQVIGWMKDLQSISVQDLKNYYQRYYAPNNAVLVVTGDVEPDQVHSLAQKYYGDYKPQDIERLHQKEPLQTVQRTIKFKKITNVPILAMIYKIPTGNDPDIIPIQALLNILINNSSSRVKVELQDKKQLILGTGSSMTNIRIPGYALIYLIPSDESQMQKSLQAFDNQFKKLINKGITDDELEIFKKSGLKSIIYNQKQTSSVAQIVARGEVRYNDPEFYEKEIKRVKKLTKADIIRVAKKYFQSDKRTIGYIFPKKGDE